MNKKDKTISCRVSTDFKEVIDTILNEISNEFYDEPRKNYRYAFEFLTDNYMDNPNFTDIILEMKLTHQIKQLNEEKEYLEYKIAKREKELQEVRERIRNTAEEENPQETGYISPISENLQRATKLLKDNCKQREIEYYESIPHEMFQAISNSCKVKKTTLIRIAKQEFPSAKLDEN